MTKSGYCIVVVSDLHHGSIYGLLPPNFVAADGSPIRQNVAQSYLWQCWDHFSDKVSRYPVTHIVVNGDAVDGEQPKSRGTELTLVRPADQCRAARESIEFLLGKFRRRPRLFMTAGTAYHVGQGARDEEALAMAVRAEAYQGEGLGSQIKEVLNLSLGGVVLNVAHHISVATSAKAAAVERELQSSVLAEMDGYPHCAAVIRSHVHSFREVVAGRRHGVTTPCWQLQTSYCRKAGVFRMRPDVGGLVVWVNPEAADEGDDPVRVQPVIYSLPKVPVVEG